MRAVLQDKPTARLFDSQAGGRQGGGEQDVKIIYNPIGYEFILQVRDFGTYEFLS